MSLKLHSACTFCEHSKCNDCREEYACDRNGKVYLLNAKELAHEEALRKQKIHQLPIGPTFRAASSSAEYTNECQTSFHTFTERIPDQSEPLHGFDEALTRKEHTPYSEVEPQGIDSNATVSSGDPPLGDKNNFDSGYPVAPECFNGAGRYSNDWGPSGFNAGNAELFATDGTTVEPQTLAHNTSVGTTNQNSAYLPSAVYSSPCEYQSEEILFQGVSSGTCPSKDITACNSCLLDSAVLEKPLACVFYKYNPEEYSSCMQKSFKDIGHLGQHLKKAHRGKIPPIPKAHQKNSNWKWYWVWRRLFDRHPPPRCPYTHPDQDMKAHTLHQFFRDLSTAQKAGVDVGCVVQSIVQGLSSSPEPFSDGQFMDTLRRSSLAQHNHDPGVYIQYRGRSLNLQGIKR